MTYVVINDNLDKCYNEVNKLINIQNKQNLKDTYAIFN